jgi:hypothetical protein
MMNVSLPVSIRPVVITDEIPAEFCTCGKIHRVTSDSVTNPR